ncbi:minichromosome maintenance protein MCM [Haladaptatus sp. DFWS20]|uniref:minichromosome maintenance protein MCM n=1 Tax=Haladaptatus sp. DFWS20 TaxID=3403467 RepID=UPI003EB7F4E5
MNDPQSIYREYGGELQTFIRRYCEDELGDLLQQYPNEKSDFWIDWQNVFQWESNVADDVLDAYATFTTVFQYAIENFDNPIDIDLNDIDVRIYNLPDDRVFRVGETRADDVTDFVGVRGQISKTSAVKVVPTEIVFQCQRCGTFNHIPQSFGTFQEPQQCEGCDRQGPFDLIWEDSEHGDQQYLQLQRPPEETFGGTGETIPVVISDELVKWVSDRNLGAGARVTVNGILRIDEHSEHKGAFDKFLDAESIEVEEQDYEELDISKHKEEIEALAAGEHGDPYELLVDSFATSHYGDEAIKKALILQLFGGVPRTAADGSHIRGDFHCFLLGDPAVGKSNLLEAARKLSPRSVSTGESSSRAGLTAAAVKDDFGDGEWSLQAGALVLANGGLATVDELDKLREDARDSIHEALEQQTVSVSKAGINATLPARTSLLAAGNPKHGRFDKYDPKIEQIDLDPALISRFDLMFTLKDAPGEAKDENIARHILESKRNAVRKQRQGEDDVDDIPVSPEVIRTWVAHAKRTIEPVATDEANDHIVDFYKRIREKGYKNRDAPVPVTARKLEAIIRVAEASARIRLSKSVEVEDVTRAIRLIEKSLEDVGVDPVTGEMDVDVIETGTSKTQRERYRIVIDAICKNDSGNGANIGDVLIDAQKHGIDDEAAAHAIQKLRSNGKVYGTDKALRLSKE